MIERLTLPIESPPTDMVNVPFGLTEFVEALAPKEAASTVVVKNKVAMMAINRL